ncbi:hypothetical protein FACS189459_0380 [Bacilli bacterium]|nr:hypothetical protein FACS189459_0380 [Bacilli bacterium]
MEKLQSDGKFEDASKLLYVTIPQLQQKLNDYENEDNSKNVARDAVTEREIAEVVSKTTGIPLNKVIDSEKVKLLSLNDELKLKVKGQDEAVDVVANAILRGRAGVNDPNRPLGSFLFMGSTGVGKTELAKALAFELFHSDKSIARFDMSEYMEKHSVSKLIGAPPGYVGYEQSGGLTEIVRRRPYTVLLFDEIEKAHPDVLNLLLQVLDDGRLRDAQGHDVNFKNTLIIMTSNIGAQSIIDGDKEKALIELKKSLKPEFINRIDEIIVFNTLNNEAINEVVEKMLNDLINRLSLQDLKISFDKSVVKKIKEDAYDPIYGARPIKRYIQKNIENLLASKIISKDLEKNKQYIIVLDKDNKFALNLRKKN